MWFLDAFCYSFVVATMKMKMETVSNENGCKEMPMPSMPVKTDIIKAISIVHTSFYQLKKEKPNAQFVLLAPARSTNLIGFSLFPNSFVSIFLPGIRRKVRTLERSTFRLIIKGANIEPFSPYP